MAAKSEGTSRGRFFEATFQNSNPPQTHDLRHTSPVIPAAPPLFPLRITHLSSSLVARSRWRYLLPPPLFLSSISTSVKGFPRNATFDPPCSSSNWCLRYLQDMEDEMEEPMPTKESINIGMVKLDDTPKLKDAVDPPSAGMIFKSIDELYEYYKTFGNQEGFPVFKKSTKNDKQGRLHFVTLSCGRGGKSRCKREKLVNPILTMKIECNAKLNARVYDDGVARVTSVFLDHNHELSPTRVRYLPRRRSVTTSIKRRREKVDEVGVDVAKPLASSSLIEYGGQEDEPSLEKMCQNYISNIDKVRKLCLDVGDAGAVCNYFNRMQEQNSNFYHSVVYDSMRKEQFDFSWGQMIQKYGLESNPWLSTLYDNRHQWVPVYVKDSFWAGMSAVQRNESVHAFFEGYTNSKTTLKQFLDRYDKALRVRVEKELHEDLNSFNYCCPCVSHYNIEKQYQQAYTDSKFKETQEEFKGKMFCYVHSVKEEDVFGVYEVIEDTVVENGLSNQKVVFTVYFKQPEFDVRCSCRLFEFRGILCRHIITLLTVKGVYSVPYKYILPRWRKDLRREHTKVKVSYNNWNTTPQMQRYDLISKKSLIFADFGSTSEENTQIALDFIEQFRQKFNIADPMAVTAQPFQ
ncbi:hypothetical protein ZIOFF_054444 [Zingiber officinale]|uniref:Protein FAR1-RELATED SEQUENCE n=1 Tax=Zingiber officinale TaxID=94328 RepID=A0A8J5FEH6_ZINOF|nr:hypothetical protein ZIOFF_054444 [Zingiber officinale]